MAALFLEAPVTFIKSFSGTIPLPPSLICSSPTSKKTAHLRLQIFRPVLSREISSQTFPTQNKILLPPTVLVAPKSQDDPCLADKLGSRKPSAMNTIIQRGGNLAVRYLDLSYSLSFVLFSFFFFNISEHIHPAPPRGKRLHLRLQVFVLFCTARSTNPQACAAQNIILLPPTPLVT